MIESFNIKDNFVERNDISDFLRENKVNSELYNIVIKLCGSQLSQSSITGIFNNAYRICTIATSKDGGLKDVKLLESRLKHTRIGARPSRVVAWCLLRLHEGLTYVSEEIVSYLYDFCRTTEVYSCCQNFVRNYAGDFDKAINFSGRAIIVEGKAAIPSVEENFMKNHSLFLDSIQEILRNNQELRNKVAAMEEKHAKETADFHSREATLRSRLADCNDKIASQASMIQHLQSAAENPRTIIKKVETPVETPVSKVFSPENLAKYAISLPKDEDANFLATSMREICVRDRFFDNNVFDTIDSISTEREKARLEMEKKQQKKPSITYNIDHVEQLNPAATRVENSYERRSVGRQLNEMLSQREPDDRSRREVFEFMNERHGLPLDFGLEDTFEEYVSREEPYSKYRRK